MKNKILATLVIDDPLLICRYGFLEYKKLLDFMKEYKFFTQIALIPYSSHKFDKKTINLFQENKRYFAIAIHGCYHTKNEFGSNDYNKLYKLSIQSLYYMEQFKYKTLLNYEKIMIFPQGLFSKEAILALKSSGFNAVFNTDTRANEYRKKTIKFSNPNLQYYNFPIFQRRYPYDTKGIKEDIQNGGPIVLVVHHNAFKDINILKNAIELINSYENIQWCSAGDIAKYYFDNNKEEIEEINIAKQNIYTNQQIFKIWFRRNLSEIRDKFIDTNKILSKLYLIVKRGKF